MWYEQYENLSNFDKGEFRKIANYLLSHTYIVSSKYNSYTKFNEYSEDYRTAIKLFTPLQEYFKLIGWVLEKDDDFGVISLKNEFEYNRVRFDKFTTLFLYTCRLIYEEERQDLSNFNCVRTDTLTIVNKMKTLGLLDKAKTTNKERLNAQTSLARFNILEKIDSGSWSSEGNNLLILPSILTVVSSESINEMIEELQDEEQELSYENND